MNERILGNLDSLHPSRVRDEEKEWIFTFGFGHEHNGQSYARKFVRVRGTYELARQEMFKRYGSKWSMQYASMEGAGVQTFGLEEVK